MCAHGNPPETHRNSLPPPAPPRPPLLRETHRKSPMSENCRLGTGSLLAFYLHSSFVCVAHTLFHTFAHHPTSPACNLPIGSLPSLYLFRRPSPFSTASNPAASASLPLFDACLFSTAPYPAAGSLLALYIVLTRVSHFNRLQYGYRCVARSLPGSDACLPFQLLPISLHVHR